MMALALSTRWRLPYRSNTGAVQSNTGASQSNTGASQSNTGAFNQVRLPRSALLDAHSSVDPATGKYTQHTEGIAPFAMIGQRLFTGRVAVAQVSS